MTEVSREGPGSTGLWVRTYELGDGWQLVASRGNPTALPFKPEREWMAVVGRDGRVHGEVVEKLEAEGTLEELASFATVWEQRMLVIKEADLEKAASMLKATLGI
jgi:hypothetical protein